MMRVETPNAPPSEVRDAMPRIALGVCGAINALNVHNSSFAVIEPLS